MDLEGSTGMKTKTILSTLLLSLMFSSAWALTEGVQKLVEFETKANAAGERSVESILLPHVEIPLREVGIDFADRLDKKIASALLFEKAGETYVRWILNPEDTKWGEELLAHFKKQGLKLKRKYRFTGYQTASRSYIAEDPVSGIQFSVKSSTNITGGNWRDKKQPVGEAIDGRLLSDFIHEQSQKRAFETFKVMDEPAILKLPAIDQAVVIRDLGELKSPGNKKYYLPGFSALHEGVGAEIALKNGSANPFEYWTEHYIKPAGRALGELAARTGLQFDSPHSQNFLVELDHRMKPTGKLILRDMSDLYVDVNFIEALQGKKSVVLKHFTQKENLLTFIAAGFGPLHGNRKPRWVSESQYSDWKQTFFSEFEASFEKTSGFKLTLPNAEKIQQGDYFTSAYSIKGKPAFSNLFEMMREQGVVRNYGGAPLCTRVLQAVGH